ncbi:MAG TPA: SPOR domain-containing protein [bacterium]|nr:SPOR domain-containing protein [bacterium]
MSDQLETVALLLGLSLPIGYRVRAVEGRLYLFDPRGIPLPGPADPSLIEAYAWRHAWRHIERELNKELVELHAGVHPLHRLRRLRQYMRMLDAVAQIPREAQRRPSRRGMVAWGAFAASAAAAAAVLLITPLRTIRVPENAPHPAASNRPATTILARHPSAAVRAKPGAVGYARVAPTTPTGPRRTTLERYAVTFGEFVNRATADTMMHLIRSKGYIVYVAQIGADFRVVTRPYRTHAQAERLANALQEIGLPAQLMTTRVI